MKKMIFILLVSIPSVALFSQRYLDKEDIYLMYGAKQDTIKKSLTDSTKWFYDGFTLRITDKNPFAGFAFKTPMDISNIKYQATCPCNINPGTCPTGAYYDVFIAHMVNEGGVIKLKLDSNLIKKPTGNIDSVDVDFKNVVYVFLKQTTRTKGCNIVIGRSGYSHDSTNSDIIYCVPKVKESTPITVGTKSAKLNNVTFYPNPTTDVVNFSTQVSSVDVCNINGVVIMSANFVNQVNLSSLAPGTYILKITDSFGNTDQEQIIKQ